MLQKLRWKMNCIVFSTTCVGTDERRFRHIIVIEENPIITKRKFLRRICGILIVKPTITNMFCLITFIFHVSTS